MRDALVGPLVESTWSQQRAQLTRSVATAIVPGAAGSPIAVIGILADAAAAFSDETTRVLESYAQLVGTWLSDLLVLRTETPPWLHSSDRWLPGFRCLLDNSGAIREAPGPAAQALKPGGSFFDSLESSSRDRARRLLYQALGGGAAEVAQLRWLGEDDAPIAPVRAHLLFTEGRPHGFFLTGWSSAEAADTPTRSRSELPAAWGVVNIDRFSSVNALHGRGTGDRLLQEFRSRLAEAAGSAGRVWRIGGDEFALRIPLPDQDRSAEAIAGRVLDAVQRPFPIGDAVLSVSATAGFSLSPVHGIDAARLIFLARSAMSRGKRRGRNQWILYEPAWGESATERLGLESGLREAILKGQLGVAFQPVVSLAPPVLLRPTGIEALVEWDHPRLGRLPASRFIPIAEDSGVIEEIGAWVFRRAVAEHDLWRRAGLKPGRLALNVSPYQVSRSGFASRILDLVLETGISPGDLEIEITENRLLEDIDEVAPRLERLREEGISIALDDFGAGYASVRLLSLLPLDAIKIDRSVTAAVADPAGTRQLIHAYVGLARQRGLRVVAEGVETVDQLDQLAVVGCHEAQGFLLSFPLAPDSLASYLRRFIPLGDAAGAG